MNMPDMKKAAKRSKEAEYIYENRTSQLLFTGKKYFIRTYGCQMNVHDSEEIKGLLELLGFTENKTMDGSDLILLNTCAIRENAHDKVFGFLGRLKNLKEKNPNIILGICGCMPQEESVANEIKEKYPYIDIVFGTHNINELPTMLKNHKKGQILNVHSKEGDVIEFNNAYKRDSKIEAWVNVMYGCDKFCSYCIVPYTRGKERSRKKEDILKEIKELKEEGYKQITLLGQNVNAYGKDLKDKTGFSDLLEMAAKTNIERIRFVTSHPWDFSDEMIEVIAKYDNIMPFIHLPVQSGSNNILKYMNRRYTKEEYITLYNKLRNKIKDSVITTDIIVGFPGESEVDFNETLNLAKELKFDGAFTFLFSPRKGTPASKMKDETPEKLKKERLLALNKVINENALNSNKSKIGKIEKVLVTSLSVKDNTKVAGYSEGMKLVNLKGDKTLIGKIIEVKITNATTFNLEGEIVK